MPDLDLNFHIVAPVLSTALAAVTVLVLDLVLPRRQFRPWGFAAALLGILLSGWYTWSLSAELAADPSGRLVAFSGAFGVDHLGLVLNGIFLFAALGAVLLTSRGREELSGYLSLVLWATSGMMVMAGAASLIAIFLGIEILSLALYVAVAGGRTELGAKEAGFKYLVLGATSSAVLLFGFAFLFGASGAVELVAIGARWLEAAEGVSGPVAGSASAPSELLFQVGFLFSLIGLVFKMALVPFHVWAPDVYEGAPTPVTAFMAVGTKAAAFGVLARLLLTLPPAGGAAGTETGTLLLLPLWVLGGLSIVVGSVAAIRQDNVKRLLAYSGVANAGYLIVALPALTDAGVAAATFYLLAYACAVLGLFACVAWLTRTGRDGARLSSFAGLFYRQPSLAAAAALFLLSLAGIPATGGFAGKLLILIAAAEGSAWALAALLVFGSAVSLYVYFRIVRLMWAPESASAAATAQTAAGFDPGAGPSPAGRTGTDVAFPDEIVSPEAIAGTAPSVRPHLAERLATAAIVSLGAAGTLLTGLFPQWAYDVVARLQVLPF